MKSQLFPLSPKSWKVNPSRSRALCFAALLASVATSQAQSLKGDLAPDFTLPVWESSETVSLSDYEGSIIVLDFFAYWCPPCQTSSPDLEIRVQEYYEERGGTPEGIPVQVLPVNIESSNPQATNAFIDNAGSDLVLDDSGSRSVYGHYSTGGIPLFVIINGVADSPSHEQWEILHHQAGYSGAAYFRSVINSVLAPEGGVGEPEIEVSFSGVPINDGDTTPQTDNGTSFGAVEIADSITHSFRVTNTGDAALNLGPETSSSAEFVVSGLVSSLPAGGYDDFTVTFNPSSTGSKTATISFTTNDSDEDPFNFTVSGEGSEVAEPEIDVSYDGTDLPDGDTSPATSQGTDFGSVDYTSGSVSRTFRVRNTGNATLSLGSATSSSSHFTLSGLASSISAGSYDVFTVVFNPSSAGTKTATISFSNNDDDENPFDFTVEGVGEAPIDHHGNSTAEASAVGTDSTVEGLLSPGDDDYFRIDLAGPGTLTVRTISTTDTFGRLLDASGAPIASDDDSGSGFNFEISHEVRTAGVFFVHVRAHDDLITGNYQLVTSFAPSDTVLWFDDASDMGDGWRWFDWFGSFNVSQDPWIFHAEHGWLYPFADGPESVFFWDNEMESILWTSQSVYPSLYRFSDGQWLFYEKGTSNPRLFVNLVTGQWEQW